MLGAVFKVVRSLGFGCVLFLSLFLLAHPCYCFLLLGIIAFSLNVRTLVALQESDDDANPVGKAETQQSSQR